MAANASAPDHITVSVPTGVGTRRSRELRAFVRFCVARIERELGRQGQWTVGVAIGAHGFTTAIEVLTRATEVRERGQAADAVLATWDAMARVEQRLREQRLVAT